MKKKIFAFTMIIAMLAILAISGTLAYFTDDGAAENVFTIGSVKIELIESYVHRSGATAYEGVEDYPEAPEGENGNHSDEQILAGSGEENAVYQEYLAAQQLMPGVEINKMPYVKNIGESDAYIRIRVLVPSALDLEVLNSSVICTTALEEEFSRPEGYSKYAVDGTTTIDGVEYDVYTFVRNEALTPDEMTYWNVWNVIRMDDETTQEEVEALIAAGAITEDYQFNVLVQADAIQAASFDNATEAFAAFDAQMENNQPQQ